MSETSNKPFFRKLLSIAVLFLGVFAATFFVALSALENTSMTVTDAQKFLYPCGFGLLLAGLAALWLSLRLRAFEDGTPIGTWFFPVLTAILAFVCMGLAYVFLGIWPIGTKTGMVVDMHHQYAPLLAELRDTLLHGDSLLYSFDVGLGASYLPLFGYYLASPLNLLLLLFPEHLLAEGLFVITLLKNVLTAALFCLAVQYIYGKKSYVTVLISLMYSMMMYLVAYSWNIMWLDCVMMLPLCVLGFERMMRENKPLVYILSLAYILYSNYYIGFMVCVFLVLYFLAFCLRQKRTLAETAGGFMRFAATSLAGGLLSMVVLIPVIFALGQTSAAGGSFQSFSTNFSLFDLLGQHLLAIKPTIRSGNLPNIYCGILAALLVPLFATTKKIPVRRRATYLGLLGIMALSMTVNNFDLFWHGLHSPNDLPYRFSFLYCFVLLLIGYETLLHLKDLSLKQIGGACGGFLIYLIIEEKFGTAEATFETLYLSLAAVLLYTLLLALGTRKKVRLEASYALLLLAVVAEMVGSASAGFEKLNGQEYFTMHDHYVDNETTEAVRQAVATMESLGDAAEDAFYRVEFLPRRTSVDTALFDYNGISVFASSNSYNETRFMGALGYAVNGVNSHLFRYFVPAVDSLVGLRYVAMNDEYEASPYLLPHGQVNVGSQTYTIYQNMLALPLGFVVKSDAKLWEYFYYSPIVSQNSLLSAMTGDAREAYSLQQLSADSAGAHVTGVYAISMGEGTAKYTCTLQQAGRVYLHVDCRAAESITANVRAATADEGSYDKDWSVTTYEPYIIDVGQRNAGDVITVNIDSEVACSGNIYVAVLNEDVMTEQLNALRQNGLKTTVFTDTRIEGTLNAAEDGTVFVSIPYDEGWTVEVDGKRVETAAFADAMLSFDVTAGEHTVTMRFLPKGFWLGLIATVLGIALTVLLCLFREWFGKFTATGEPALPFDLPDEEAITDENDDAVGLDEDDAVNADVSSPAARQDYVTYDDAEDDLPPEVAWNTAVSEPLFVDEEAEQPSIEPPSVEQPLVEEPLAEQPSVEQPSVEQSSMPQIPSTLEQLLEDTDQPKE